MDKYLSEIMEQPAKMRYLYDSWAGSRELSLIGEDYKKAPKPIIFLGMGSSNFAPISVRTRLNRLKIPFYVYDAGEFLHYEIENVPQEAWVVAISQSGESFETCASVKALKNRVGRIIAITNEKESTLAHLADTVLLLCAGQEKGSTTKTFMNTLLALHLLINTIETSGKIESQDIMNLISITANLTESLMDETNKFISTLKISDQNTLDPLHLIARGPTLATALQSSLVLSETTGIFSQALSGGTFRHGPYELTGTQHRALIFAPSGKTQSLLLKLAKELYRNGSKIILISDTKENVPYFKLTLPTVNEDLAPLLYFLPVEFFIWNLAKKRGREPGIMQNMGKVTKFE
ncbi:SIS domain-containing protein [Sporolactobacillus terrae]|uniref:SIS domain-containing protein n=1 Tax=Sporolactobacillus terrae TaxID=269673 RepID=UPI00055DE16E|nr:SIS domain-containing protein [Sporolactobacillus terrae]